MAFEILGAINFVIDSCEHNHSGVHNVVRGFWDSFDFGEADLKDLAMEGFQERVIRVARRRHPPVKLQRYYVAPKAKRGKRAARVMHGLRSWRRTGGRNE